MDRLAFFLLLPLSSPTHRYLDFLSLFTKNNYRFFDHGARHGNLFFRCFSLYILHDDSFIRATRFWFSILRLSSNYLSTSPSYFIISHSIHSLAYAHSLIHSLIHSFIQSIITFFPCTSPWLSDSLYVRSRDMKIRCNDSIRIDYFLFFFRFISPIYSSTHPLFIHFHYFRLQLFFALSRPLD